MHPCKNCVREDKLASFACQPCYFYSKAGLWLCVEKVWRVQKKQRSSAWVRKEPAALPPTCPLNFLQGLSVWIVKICPQRMSFPGLLLLTKHSLHKHACPIFQLFCLKRNINSYGNKSNLPPPVKHNAKISFDVLLTSAINTTRR